MTKDYQKILKEGKISKMLQGDTNEVFLLEFEGEKYVLRKVKDKETVDRYLAIYEKLRKYDFLPKILYQNGESLLIEFIQGRDCIKEDANHVAVEVGKICAIITKEIKPFKKFDIQKKFYENLNIIRTKNILNLKELDSIKELFDRLNDKVKPKVVAELFDAYCENFRLSKEDKLYLIDFNAISTRFEGSGIAKAFSRWFRTPDQQNLFWKGYNSILPRKFWTEDYAMLADLYFTLNVLSNQIRNSQETTNRDICKLKEYVLKK